MDFWISHHCGSGGGAPNDFLGCHPPQASASTEFGPPQTSSASTSLAIVSVSGQISLASSVMSALMSVCAAHRPSPMVSALPSSVVSLHPSQGVLALPNQVFPIPVVQELPSLVVPEVLPLSSVLPVMATAILCVWVVHAPPEETVSAAASSETSALPITAMEVIPELSVCSNTAKEAVSKLTSSAGSALAP